MIRRNLTVFLEKEDDGFVSLCPELDIASQGDSVEEAKANLKEAVELFFETAAESEISERLHEEIYISNMEIMVG
jgi:predicted RNase H-like HicB family nuclease